MTDIKGYKPLTDWQKEAMNQVKELEANILHLLRSLSESSEPTDGRWISIARTSIEQGCMAACRAITQPDTVAF